MSFNLNRRIELLQPVTVGQTAAGQQTATYTARPVRAHLVRSSGHEYVDDPINASVQNEGYIVRFLPGLSTAWKARVNGVFHDIEAVLPLGEDEGRRWLQIKLKRTRKTLEVVEPA